MQGMTRRMIRAAATATAAATVLAVSACGSGGAGSAGTVKVGLLANLTGNAAPSFGKPFQAGVDLALKDAQPALDEAGVKIEVVTEDAKSEVPAAVTGYNKLRSEDVAVVLQDSQSPLGQALAPLVNDDKIPMLSGAGSELENKDGYAFRFTDLGTPTKAMGPYLAKAGAKRVGAVVTSDNPSFATLADATEAGLSGGYASRQEIATADSDFSAVLANLRKNKVDAIVLSALPAQVGNLLLQMKQSGGFEDVELIGTVATSQETYTVAKDAAVGFAFPQVWAPGAKGAGDFEAAFEGETGEKPTAYGALGYQVTWITVAAILEASKKGDVNGEAIRDALPAASQGDLVTKNGILDLTLDAEGKATSTGVIATFDKDGHMVTSSQGN